MTVTKDQAQMIATLAIACRPHRAPTWDAPGVLAQLAKVAQFDLAEVISASVRLARDPSAKTPADIAKPTSECWREVLKAPKWAPEKIAPGERCSVCGKHQNDCRRLWTGDHEFSPNFKNRDVDITPVIAELKGHVASIRPPTEPAEHKPNPHVTEARDLLHGGAM